MLVGTNEATVESLLAFGLALVVWLMSVAAVRLVASLDGWITCETKLAAAVLEPVPVSLDSSVSGMFVSRAVVLELSQTDGLAPLLVESS